MACRLGSIVLSVGMLAGFLGGCAGSVTATSTPDQNDPYESINRRVFAVNDALDRNVALPVAKVYVRIIPQPARNAVHNGLSNLASPVTLANDILQGEAKRAVQTLGRMVVNTTIGLAGMVDVATPMGIPGHTADFGETLATYGVDEGPYLVLPLLGPSNPRDAGGHLVDTAFDPLTYIGMREKGLWMGGRSLLGMVDDRAGNIDAMATIQRSSVDVYATLRSLYRQHRNSEIHGGQPNLQELPNI